MRNLCNLLYFSIILDVRSFPSYAPAIYQALDYSEDQRKRFDHYTETRGCISGHWATEARTGQSLWPPAVALATGMNTSFLGGLYKNHATILGHLQQLAKQLSIVGPCTLASRLVIWWKTETTIVARLWCSGSQERHFRKWFREAIVVQKGREWEPCFLGIKCTFHKNCEGGHLFN